MKLNRQTRNAVAAISIESSYRSYYGDAMDAGGMAFFPCCDFKSFEAVFGGDFK